MDWLLRLFKRWLIPCYDCEHRNKCRMLSLECDNYKKEAEQ